MGDNDMPSDGRLTVLQVLPRLGTGGVERGTVDVATALVAGGDAALVASEGGALEADLARAGARHFHLPVASKAPWTIAANARRLAEVMRANGVDVIHARSRAPAWSAWRAARLAGCPFVTTYHGTYTARGRLKRAYNRVMASGDIVIAISAFIRDHIVREHGVDPVRLRVIPRGIDPDRFDPDRVDSGARASLRRAWTGGDPDRPVVVVPGRLARWKGQFVAIQALARLGRDDVILVLAGDAPARSGYRAFLEEMAKEAGVGGRVVFAGDRGDMPAVYAAADVSLSTSVEPEAFGRVMAEAMAMATPVIATAHGGALEQVAEGETGYLVAPGDPEALASRLEQLLAEPAERRTAMGRAGRTRVLERFTTRKMCDATRAVYRELVQGSRDH